jgi:hypothetical protein
MATISTLNIEGTTHRTRQDHNVPYLAECVIDFAKALTAKGSALAANDIIETIVVPVGTVVMNAGLQTLTVDDATTLTLNLGVTGAGGLGAEDVDEYVAAYDQAAAVALAYSPQLDTVPIWRLATAADTIDLALATLTGTLTVGKVRVWALLLDVSNSKKKPGIVALGS